MRTVDIEYTIAAPIEDVFDWLTDATNYWMVPTVREVTLIRPGDIQGSGNGAVREVRAWLLSLTEHVVEYRRPTLMRYRIEGSCPKLRHDEGFMEFRAVPGGTQVRWYTRFEVAAPVVSGPLTLWMQWVVIAGFRIVLHTAAIDLRRFPLSRAPGGASEARA